MEFSLSGHLQPRKTFPVLEATGISSTKSLSQILASMYYGTQYVPILNKSLWVYDKFNKCDVVGLAKIEGFELLYRNLPHLNRDMPQTDYI